MVDGVHIDRHPLALGEQVGNADWRDSDFLFHGKSPSRDFRRAFHFVKLEINQIPSLPKPLNDGDAGPGGRLERFGIRQ
jgi:hypothetical protein